MASIESRAREKRFGLTSISARILPVHCDSIRSKTTLSGSLLTAMTDDTQGRSRLIYYDFLGKF